MREIVHLQAGQCGNQIGSKVRIINMPFVCHTHSTPPVAVVLFYFSSSLHIAPNLTCLIIKQNEINALFALHYLYIVSLSHALSLSGFDSIILV